MNKEKVSLVLGGGGAKASFGIGIIKYLLEKYEIEAVSGTSVGAINGVFVSSGKFNEIYDMWSGNIKILKDLFMKTHPFGILQGLLFKNALYDSDPVRTKMKEIIKPEDLKNANFSCVYSDAIRSKKVTKYSHECDYDNMIESVMASFALVPAYKPIKIDGTVAIDGGYTEGVPMESIQPLLKESKKVFVILTDLSGTEKDDDIKETGNILSSFNRALRITMDSLFDYNVKYGKLKYWENDNRVVLVYPPKQIFESAIDFDEQKIKAGIQLGYDHAKELNL